MFPEKKEDYCTPAMKLILQVFLEGIYMFKDGEDLFRHMEESNGRQRHCKMTCRLRGVMENLSVIYKTGKNSKFKIVFGCWSFIVRLVEWCFTSLSTVFQSYHGDSSLFMTFLGFTSTTLGL